MTCILRRDRYGGFLSMSCVETNLMDQSSEQTHATLSAFFVAMSLFPEVQAKAREELDAVIGGSRLPTLADRDHLPYINAIVKETLRWHNAAPLLIPHYSTADDTYNGFVIPANSVVIVNAWYVCYALVAGCIPSSR